jgi:hypothetical protein
MPSGSESERRTAAAPSASEDAVVDETLPGQVDDPQSPALATARQRVVGEHRVRGRLAAALTALFAVTVLAALATAIFGSRRADAQVVDILRDLLPAELAILGSALGFYFGGR